MLSTRAALGVSLSIMLLGCGNGEATGEVEASTMSVAKATVGPGSCFQPSYFAKQGQLLQGTRGSSFTLQSVSLGCHTATDLHVQGAELVATSNGQTVQGRDFIGGTVTMRDAQGGLASARIDGVDSDTTDASGATFLYTLTYVDPQTGATSNACTPDASGVAKALPMRGRWDISGAHQDADTAISFACTSGVLAKCVRWGYRPWQTQNGTALADYHQACTRMARADYCGDGQTHTQEGTQIDIYDRLSLLDRVPALLSLFEATWTPSGAYCVSRSRWLSIAGLLPTACSQQFELAIESSPVDPADLCLARRIGASRADALLSNSTGVNIHLL